MDKETIAHLGELARIQLSEDEQAELSSHLQKIVAYMSDLDGINTEGVKPCLHIMSDTQCPLAEDVEGDSLDHKTFLDNAPAHTGGMIRVPCVIQF